MPARITGGEARQTPLWPSAAELPSGPHAPTSCHYMDTNFPQLWHYPGISQGLDLLGEQAGDSSESHSLSSHLLPSSSPGHLQCTSMASLHGECKGVSSTSYSEFMMLIHSHFRHRLSMSSELPPLCLSRIPVDYGACSSGSTIWILVEGSLLASCSYCKTRK